MGARALAKGSDFLTDWKGKRRRGDGTGANRARVVEAQAFCADKESRTSASLKTRF
jgi:hypothetical protein